MRPIDADELKKRAVKVRFADVPDCGEFDAVGVSDIDIMPTIDPETLRPEAEWISVKDRLPEMNENVLVYGEYGVSAAFLYSDNNHWYITDTEDWDEVQGVTHWMPLSKPPNKTNETPSRMLTPDRIRHLAKILENEYRDRTVTIDNLIYMLRRLADIIAEDEPPKEEP